MFFLCVSMNLALLDRLVNLIRARDVSEAAICRLEDFLVHPYPRVSDSTPKLVLNFQQSV